MILLYDIFNAFVKQTKLYVQSVLPKKISELENDAGYITKKQITEIQTGLTFDDTPTAGSTNPVTSDGIQKAIAAVSTSIDLTGYVKKDFINDCTETAVQNLWTDTTT